MSWLLGVAGSLAVRAGVPLWAVVGAGIGILLLLFGGSLLLLRNSIWNEGYAVCDTKWTAKALEAKITKLQNELDTTKRSQALDDANDTELEAENDELQKKVTAYETERKKRGDYCPLGNDARRVQ